MLRADEVPLVRAGATHKSDVIISKSLDKAVDKANPAPKNAAPGISIRHGPMVEMEIDEPIVNGTDVNGNASGKRKARNSTGRRKSYKEASDEEDEKPLVRQSKFRSEKATTRLFLTAYRLNGVVWVQPKLYHKIARTRMMRL